MPYRLQWPSRLQSWRNGILSSCRLFPDLGIRCQFIWMRAKSRICHSAAPTEAVPKTRVPWSSTAGCLSPHGSLMWGQAGAWAISQVGQAPLDMNAHFLKSVFNQRGKGFPGSGGRSPAFGGAGFVPPSRDKWLPQVDISFVLCSRIKLPISAQGGFGASASWLQPHGATFASVSITLLALRLLWVDPASLLGSGGKDVVSHTHKNCSEMKVSH